MHIMHLSHFDEYDIELWIVEFVAIKQSDATSTSLPTHESPDNLGQAHPFVGAPVTQLG